MPRRGTYRPQGDPRRGVGYVRAADGLAQLVEQRRALDAWTDANKVALIDVSEEQLTADELPLYEREGFPAALRRVHETGAGVLLVAKADCISPETLIWAEAAELAKMGGARLVSCADDAPENSEVASMRAAFSDFDALSRSVPISVGLRAKKGKLRSRVPP